MRCAAAPLGGGPIRVDDGGRAGATMVALVSADPSLSTAEVRAGRRERQRTRNNREGTMPLSSKEADRTCRVGPTARVVEPALYTVDGRQTADLRQTCGSALIRKAKLPSRSGGGVPSDGDG